jgi:NAD(P)-dependent dehydrogenase (short-subunit alcohol dehydrogenase family)
MMLKGKVAVIYGAGGGIGGAVARAFAARAPGVFLPGTSGHRSNLSPRTSCPPADPPRRPRSTLSTSPEEMANVAAFMASDKASGMTGTTVNLTMGSLDD